MKFILKEEHKWTVVIISNDEDVMRLCDTTIIMKEGILVWKGPFEETINNEHFTKIV